MFSIFILCGIIIRIKKKTIGSINWLYGGHWFCNANNKVTMIAKIERKTKNQNLLQ